MTDRERDCPPDCMPCRVARGDRRAAVRAALHRECGHWRPEQRWDSEFVIIMCALFWELGRKYGRAEAHEERTAAERTAAVMARTNNTTTRETGTVDATRDSLLALSFALGPKA